MTTDPYTQMIPLPDAAGVEYLLELARERMSTTAYLIGPELQEVLNEVATKQAITDELRAAAFAAAEEFEAEWLADEDQSDDSPID